MTAPYPLRIEHERTLPDRYRGPVFVWDIDKTYLDTHFSSMRGLGRIPIEFAVDKQAIPGMPEVLRGIRRGPGPGYKCAPLYFVTASPPQLKGVLQHRMLLDGVEFDGIIFKDWWQILRQCRPGRLRDQVGFKVCALLEGRLRRPLAVEYLFGDDAERDPDAFSLYAMLLRGDLGPGETVDRLARAGVREDNRRCIFALLDRLPDELGTVKRFFIHLEKGTPPGQFDRFGPIAVPVRNAFQLGLALYGLGLVDRDAVRQCREAVYGASDPGQEGVTLALRDAIERGLITARKARSLGPALPSSVLDGLMGKGRARARTSTRRLAGKGHP